MSRAAVYCRVSDPSESFENVSLQTQRDACVKHAQDNGYEVDARFCAGSTEGK